MTFRILVAACVSASMIPTTQARADFVDLEFEGTVQSLTRGSLIAPGIAVGDRIHGVVSYDTRVLPQPITGEMVAYLQDSPASFRVNLGTTAFEADGPFVATVLNKANNPGERDFSFVLSDGAMQSQNPVGDDPSLAGETILVQGESVNGILALGFDELSSPTRGPGFDLPLDVSLSNFQISSGVIRLEPQVPFEHGPAILDFSIDRIANRIPEPNALLLFITTLCIIVSMRRAGWSR